ncbi:MAG: prepilin-type N-terminal cleavage/methylation domain-containing protein [Candidatus Saccharimonas sp.]
MTTNRQRQYGFTLVELTIALAFLSILLIAILSLTLAAGKLYIKGTTNKSINQSGREIQDIVRRDFLAADASAIGNVLTEGDPARGITGRVCLGKVTYLWNTADILNDISANGSTYRIRLSGAPIRFARVVDTNADLCIPNMSGRLPTTLPADRTTELLGGDGRDFSLYDVSLLVLSTRDTRGMYEMKYTIGTNDQGTVEDTDGYVRCKPNSSSTANFDYCSVTDFDMVLRVEGGVK